MTPAPVKIVPAVAGTVAGAVKAANAVPVRAAVILATAVGPTSPRLEVKPRIKPLKVGASANCSHSWAMSKAPGMAAASCLAPTAFAIASSLASSLPKIELAAATIN